MAIYRRERSTRLLVVALVVTSLVIITLDFRGGQRGPLAAAGRISLAIISPLQDGIAKVFRPIGSFFSNLASLGSLRAENERLQAELAELQAVRVRFLEYERRIKQLTALLEFRETQEVETIGATVISEVPSNFEASVTIDRGSADGVELDMPVVAAEGLVGRVVSVSKRWSKVLLLIDVDHAVHARLASTGETGILRGQRERDLRFDLIDPGTPVEAGEPVVTSGQDGVYPPGIEIGSVSHVAPNESALQEQILVRPYVDVSRLSDVLVVLSGGVVEGSQR
ncbi:MAG TPA: rod shape-determining protein MreC [Actinomycetota bacterium]